MKIMKQYLIGGLALQKLGSPRNTNDADYIAEVGSDLPFINDTKNNVDYVNANGHPFFREVFDLMTGVQEIASPQALLELKAFSFVQHCQNGNWAKANNDEFDIKFIVRTLGVKEIKIAHKFISAGELAEVNKVIETENR